MTFLLTALVYVGRSRPIIEEFEARFGKTVSKQYLSDLRNDKDNLEVFEEIQKTFEKGMSREYMASKRRRVSAMTEIYEISMEYKAYKLAKECISAIDDMMENTNKGNLAIIQFKQYNQYADMPLKDIRTEKVRLLKMLENAKMINKDSNIEDSTIEVKNGE